MRVSIGGLCIKLLTLRFAPFSEMNQHVWQLFCLIYCKRLNAFQIEPPKAAA
jgi:hypothetical protein